MSGQPGAGKLEPMTEADIRQRHHDGEGVTNIAAMAKRRNGWSIYDVRAIIFGGKRS